VSTDLLVKTSDNGTTNSLAGIGHHRCNLLLIPTALVMPSTAHRALSSCCLPTAAIVTMAPSSLQLLSSRLPPPALVAPSNRQHDDITPAVKDMMQSNDLV
jgi:hypothetical protein